MKLTTKDFDRKDNSVKEKQSYVLLHLMSLDETCEIARNLEDTNSNVINASLVVNGVEVDIEKTFVDFYDHISNIAEGIAKEMVRDCFDDKINEIQNSLADLSNKADILSREFDWDLVYKSPKIKLNPFENESNI